MIAQYLLKAIRARNVAGLVKSSVSGCDSHLEAVGDAARPVDEEFRRRRRANLPRSGFKQIEPAIEMCAIDGKPHMLLHGLSVIAA